MMFDNLNPHNGRDRARRDGASQQPAEPLTDREVPLGVSRTPASVQAWLDGDAAEDAIQGADARHVERNFTIADRRRGRIEIPARPLTLIPAVAVARIQVVSH